MTESEARLDQRLAEITDLLKDLGLTLHAIMDLLVHEHVDGRDHAHVAPSEVLSDMLDASDPDPDEFQGAPV